MSTTPENPPAGWYADPGGANGQRYWDGHQWRMDAAPAGAAKIPMDQVPGIASYSGVPAQPGGAGYGVDAYGRPPSPSDDRITKSDIKNWATHGLAGYAAILGIASIPLNILCGVGFALGLPALAMGFFAYRSSQPSSTGRKLALTGMICGGIGSAIGLVAMMIIFSLGAV